jgi:hypothetical protein
MNAEGFALTVDATISVFRVCGGSGDTITATLSGTAAITPQ